MKLGRKIALRQRVIATAIVFFKRFYLKNAYSETDPFLVIAACCYVATKAEECPVSIKVIASEARALFSRTCHFYFTSSATTDDGPSEDNYNVKSTIFDHTKIAEMEFYLVDDLECDLTVFHPYRTLTALCKPDPSSSSGGAATTGSTGADTETEEGEAIEEDSLGVGVSADDGPRYWGTGEGQLELPEGGFQHAW
jgi:cyclin C